MFTFENQLWKVVTLIELDFYLVFFSKRTELNKYIDNYITELVSAWKNTNAWRNVNKEVTSDRLQLMSH